MAKNNDKLSGADVRRFDKAVDKLDAGITRQEEIAKKVLKIEEKIGKVRIGSLDKYFDKYSKGLDEIIARKTSQLDDAFLIMERKALESYKKAMADVQSEYDTGTKAAKAKNKSATSDEAKNNKQEVAQKRDATASNADIAEINRVLSDIAKLANTLKDTTEQLGSFNKKYSTQEKTSTTATKQQNSANQIKSASKSNHNKSTEEYYQAPSALEYQRYSRFTADNNSANSSERREVKSRNASTPLDIEQVNVEQAAIEDLKIPTQEENLKAATTEPQDSQSSIELLRSATEADRRKANEDFVQTTRQAAAELTAPSSLSFSVDDTSSDSKEESPITPTEATDNGSVQVGQVVSDNKIAELNENGGPRTAENILGRIQDYYKRSEEERNSSRLEDINNNIASQEQLNIYKSKLEENKVNLENEAEAVFSKLNYLTDKESRKQAVKDNSDIYLLSEILAAEQAVLKNEEAKVASEAKREAFSNEELVKILGEQFSERTRAEEEQASRKELEEKKAKYIQDEKRKIIAKDGAISAEQAAQILKDAADIFIDTEAALNDITEKRAKREERAKKKEEEAEKKRVQAQTEAKVKSLTEKGKTWKERKEDWYDLTHDADTGEKIAGAAGAVALKVISSLADELESKIDQIASSKNDVDTRLQGSNLEKTAGSYWDKIVHDMTSVSAVTPYFKQEDFASKIKDLVDSGIAFDLEQRAFLATITNKIATTFDVADSTLLRLIRIQQQDSTAGRLGMESALNAFLNNMYENTEYLKNVADGVRSSLEEMQALMEGSEATEVEYQVQKWLGSLYSVGMSQNAVNSISSALGQIAAGQIEGLTNGGAGNLLIMAANEAGLSIADILTNGIDASDTNKLLSSAVSYLADLAESAQDNKVVQQQLADVFGVKASDLKAATNLVLPGTTSTISSTSMTYDLMVDRLYEMAGSMAARTSVGEMISNLWENATYSLAGSMASNPLSYIVYKAATLVDDVAGGIAIPSISVLGSGVDLETTVSDIMRVASVGMGVLGSVGSIVQGIGNSFSGRAMLDQLGIKSGAGLTMTPRGDETTLSSAGSIGGGNWTTSSSGGVYAGNASGSDVLNSTLREADDDKKQQMVEAKEAEENNQLDNINTTVVKIYELLNDVANGRNSLKVKVEGYGLTNAAASAVQGGIAALTNLVNDRVGNTVSSNNSSSDTGGWTSI